MSRPVVSASFSKGLQSSKRRFSAANEWRRLILLLAVALGGASLAAGQDNSRATPKRARTLADYEVRTLGEMPVQRSTNEGLGNMAENLWVYPNILPSRVRLTYQGRRRPAPQLKREVLRQWARLYAGFPEGYTKPYETELQFGEAGKEYWLAVRTASLAQLKKEFRRGDAVDVYLIRVGAAKTSVDWEPMLLVEHLLRAK